MEVTPTRGTTSTRKAQKPTKSSSSSKDSSGKARKRQRGEQGAGDPVEECNTLQDDFSSDDEDTLQCAGRPLRGQILVSSRETQETTAVKEALARALAAHSLRGCAAAVGALPASSLWLSPGLHVKGVGSVGLPLTLAQVLELKEAGSPDWVFGPFATRIDAAAASFVNPGWATAVAAAKDATCSALGLEDAENVHAEVSHLLLWESLGRLSRCAAASAEDVLSAQPPPDREVAAVVLLSLPGASSPDGPAAAAASGSGLEWALQAPKASASEPTFLAVRGGAAIRPAPPQSGGRVDVVLSLTRPRGSGSGGGGSGAAQRDEAIAATRAALAAWAANDQAPPALVFLLGGRCRRSAVAQAAEAADAAAASCPASSSSSAAAAAGAGPLGMLEWADFAVVDALADALRREEGAGAAAGGRGASASGRADAFLGTCTVTTSGPKRGQQRPRGGLLPPQPKHHRRGSDSQSPGAASGDDASPGPFDGEVSTSVELGDLLSLCPGALLPPPHAGARLFVEVAEDDAAVAGAPSPGRATGLVDAPSAVVLNVPAEGLEPDAREEPGFGELRLVARRAAAVLWRHGCAAQLLCRDPAAAAERLAALAGPAPPPAAAASSAPLAPAASALAAALLVQLALYAVNSGHCLTATSSAAVRAAVEAALVRAGGAAAEAVGAAAARELLRLRPVAVYGEDFEPSDFADTAVQRGEVLQAFGGLMPACAAFVPACAAAAGAVAARGTLLEAARLLEGAARGGGARFRACAAALARVAAEQRKTLLRRCSGDEAAFALAKLVPLLRERAPDLIPETLGPLLFLHKRLPVSALPQSLAEDLLVPAALLSVAPEELCQAAVASLLGDARLRAAPPEERVGGVLARCLATLREQQSARQERPLAGFAAGGSGIFDSEAWVPAALPDWSLPLAFCPTGRRCPVCHGLVSFLEDGSCREAVLEDLKTSHVRHVRRVLRAVVPGLAVVAESTAAPAAAAGGDAGAGAPAARSPGGGGGAWRVRVRKLRPRNWSELEEESVMIGRADVFQELLLVLGGMRPEGLLRMNGA